MDNDRTLGRRIAIGAVVVALLLLVAYIALSFVAVLVFAVFLYYAVRPIHRFLARFGLPRRVRAMLALVLFGVPFVILLGYTIAIIVVQTEAFLETYAIQDQVVSRALEEVDLAGLDLDELEQVLTGAAAQASLSTLLVSLAGAVSLVGGVLVQLLIVVVLAYYMLVDGPRLVSWLLETYDESGALEAYVRAVDPELSLTLFGNIVNVFATAIVAVATFYAYNFFAPPTVHVPFPALVGALAGIGSLIPVVGIKLVYIPVTLLLAGNAVLDGNLSLLVPVGVLAAVSAVVVDFIPDFFIRAHISGEETHTGLLLLAYVVGPIVFGFYGLFLVPMLLILAANAVHILLPYALTGDPPGVRQSRLREYDEPRDAVPSVGSSDRPRPSADGDEDA
ncbi:AI-2E family transporter [Natrialbaceae archaeon GCM10025810]|uniref:AI-2E family transporter n=1 Tax=Halovalidus salilacus TaxID=3075124 RepID=UPI003616A906